MNAQGTIWPNFFIVGAQKCGTTSIYYNLKKHQQVFLPELKEPAFFANPPDPGESLVDPDRRTPLDKYQRLYQGARGFDAIGDASPHYLSDDGSARRIYEVCPGARIIIMLRDPVVRAHSAFLMNLTRGSDSAPTFEDALEKDKSRKKSSWFTAHRYVEAGLYYDQVRRYLDVFGGTQVQIFLFDDLSTKPRELFSNVARHIGIDSAPFGTMDLSEGYNLYKVPRWMTGYRIGQRLGLGQIVPVGVRQRLVKSVLFKRGKKPPLDERSRRFLQGIYDPDISRLEDLLGRKIPELRKSWI